MKPNTALFLLLSMSAALLYGQNLPADMKDEPTRRNFIYLDSKVRTLEKKVKTLDTATATAEATGLTSDTIFSGDVSGKYNSLSVADNSHRHDMSTLDITFPKEKFTGNFLVDYGLIQPNWLTDYALGNINFNGDVTGPWSSLEVTDDSHGHTPATLTGVVTSSTAINVIAPLSGGGDLSNDRTISISSAGPTSDGYLKFSDWSIFNDKQPAGSYRLTTDTIAWTDLAGFPSACSAGQFVTAVGSTLTCDTPSGTGSGGNMYTTGGVTGQLVMYSDTSTGTASGLDPTLVLMATNARVMFNDLPEQTVPRINFSTLAQSPLVVGTSVDGITLRGYDMKAPYIVMYSTSNPTYPGWLSIIEDGAQKYSYRTNQHRFTGSVGIGTTADASGRLHVKDGLIYNDGSDAGITTTGTCSATYFNSSSAGYGKNILTLGGAGTNYGALGVESAAGQSAWSLGYQAGMSSTLGTPVLTWNESGNVGIGSITPYSKLHVSSGVFTVDGTGAGAIIRPTSIGELQFWPSEAPSTSSAFQRLSFLNSNSGVLSYIQSGYDTDATDQTRYTDISIVATQANSRVRFFTANTENAYLDEYGVLNISSAVYFTTNGIPGVSGSRWGYSASHPATVVGRRNGPTGGSGTVGIMYDPKNNSTNAFSGNGKEVLFPNGVGLITPNDADTAIYRTITMVDGKVGLYGITSPTVGFERTCPSGFTSVKAGNNQLGCMQTARSAGKATYWDANDYCFDNYGGRLPLLSEFYVSANNFTLTDATGQWQWIADYSGPECARVGISSITGVDYATSCTGTNYYRCWIPK